MSCKSTEHTLEKLPDTYLSFGSGGGFAGAHDETFFFENGQVLMSKTFVDSTIVLPKVDKSEISALINQILDENLLTYKLFDPGNMYYFLKMKIDGAEAYIVWGNKREQCPPELRNIYNKLNQLAIREEVK